MLFRAVLYLALLSVATAAPYTSLYFFGDSLTDTGNVLAATSALGRYTFGLVPVHPTAPYATGRFTDGPVWAEHVAARLDRPGDAAPAGMSMGLFGQIGGPGNNYAVGGARTDHGGALGLLDYALPTGLATQVDFYFDRTAGTADPDALYFLFAGGNDIRDAARIADPATRTHTAQTAGANIAYSVRDLYLSGARNFVLLNSPDLGLIPETIGDGLAAEGAHASVEFNTWMELYAQYLTQEVPGLTLHYFDTFALHHELVDRYGMDAVRPCKSEPPGTCLQTLFFDSVHPTAWTHEIIGNRLADQILGTTSISLYSSTEAMVENPEPATWFTTACALVLAVAMRRRRSAGHGRAEACSDPARTSSCGLHEP
jgi:phospholipase/lecithinase/hemolysin